MHSIEYDGASPAPWKVTADDGTEWHAATDAEAALELAAFIIGRDQQAVPALPEGTVTTGTAGQAGSSPSATASASSSASSSPARVGSTLTLTGNDPGEKMSVTVTHVISHAKPADEFSSPDPGKRFYAVQFRLADTGTTAYSDSPSNGAAVVDADGQSYQSTIYDVAGCQSFPGTENIAAGDKGLGCVVFQVPDAAKITKVQFTLDSGFGPATGQWDVRG